jgi:hypothetical protein
MLTRNVCSVMIVSMNSNASNWTHATMSWPGLLGSVRAERRLLPGGRLVAVLRRGGCWRWLARDVSGRWNGMAQTRAAAMTAALYAGEVC